MVATVNPIDYVTAAVFAIMIWIRATSVGVMIAIRSVAEKTASD